MSPMALSGLGQPVGASDFLTLARYSLSFSPGSHPVLVRRREPMLKLCRTGRLLPVRLDGLAMQDYQDVGAACLVVHRVNVDLGRPGLLEPAGPGGGDSSTRSGSFRVLDGAWPSLFSVSIFRLSVDSGVPGVAGGGSHAGRLALVSWMEFIPPACVLAQSLGFISSLVVVSCPPVAGLRWSRLPGCSAGAMPRRSGR